MDRTLCIGVEPALMCFCFISDKIVCEHAAGELNSAQTVNWFNLMKHYNGREKQRRTEV